MCVDKPVIDWGWEPLEQRLALVCSGSQNRLDRCVMGTWNTFSNKVTKPSQENVCVCVCVCVRERERERVRVRECV